MITSLALVAVSLVGDVVPATSIGPYLQVRGVVNGTPLNLIVDTGAGLTVLTPRAAKASKVTGGAPVRAVGEGGGAVTAKLAKAESIQIGKATVKDEQVVILDLPAELACDGLVGYSFLRHFVTSFDYARPSLTFTERAVYRRHVQDEALEMVLKSNHPHIQGRILGKEGLFVIDTGAGGVLTLYKPFVDAGSLREKFPPRLTRITGKGVGGFVTGDTTTLSEVQFGNFRLDQVPSVLARHTGAGGSKDNAGSIGASILRKFIMTLDYEGRMVFLRKSSLFGQPYDLDRAGLFLSFESGKYKVVEVVEGTPAATAGLKVGDELLQVGKMNIESAHPLKVRAAFRGEAGSTLKVIVMRQGKRVSTSLTLRDL